MGDYEASVTQKYEFSDTAGSVVGENAVPVSALKVHVLFFIPCTLSSSVL